MAGGKKEQVSLKPLFSSAAPLRLFNSSNAEHRHWAELISLIMKEGGKKETRHECRFTSDTELTELTQLQSYPGFSARLNWSLAMRSREHLFHPNI